VATRDIFRIFTHKWGTKLHSLIKNKGYMLDLSIQDKFDGLGKVDELRSAIGENYLGNNELLNVSKNGNRCIVLRDNQKVSEPSWLTWNRMFS